MDPFMDWLAVRPKTAPEENTPTVELVPTKTLTAFVTVLQLHHARIVCASSWNARVTRDVTKINLHIIVPIFSNTPKPD